MAAAVLRSLRHAIFAGQYAPGDAMLELPLARKFGVSQAVIRESLSELAHAGLVRRIPNKGRFVMSMTPVEIGEHVRLRLTLETMLRRLASRRCARASTPFAPPSPPATTRRWRKPISIFTAQSGAWQAIRPWRVCSTL
jgi:DNA-binding GntR family transcriptional regulator